MWFSNALHYRCQHLSIDKLEQLLSDSQLKPCPNHSRFNFGWLPTINELMLHSAQNVHLFTMGKNEKILPRGVINQQLAEKAEEIELAQDRKLKRAEKAQMKEEIEFELLPKAFCITKRLQALYDHSTEILTINSSSVNGANQLLALLRKTDDNVSIEPLSIEADLTSSFTDWVNNPNLLPEEFELAPNCVLYSPQDENKKLNCKGYELPADEICNLIEQGLAVNELNLIWKERIRFSLNSSLVLKRLKCVDYLLDEFNEVDQTEDLAEMLDASLCLLGGELKQLTHDLLSLLTPQKETPVQVSQSNEVTIEESVT